MTVRYKDPNDEPTAAQLQANPNGNGHGFKIKDFGEQAIQQVGRRQQGGSAIENATSNVGILSPQEAAYQNQIRNNYLAPIYKSTGLTPDQLTQAFQQNRVSAAQQQQLNSGAQNAINAQVDPDTWYDKLFGQLALGTTIGVATAGVGSGVGAAVGGGFGGAVAGGAAAGAVGAGLTDALTGQPLTAGSIGKGAGMGALGGAASGFAPQLSAATGLTPGTSAGLLKAGAGALGAGLTGGNPLQSAVQSGVGSLVGGGLGAVGLGGLGGIAGNVLGGMAGRAVAGPSNGALAPVGQNNMMGGGSIYPSQGNNNPFSGAPNGGLSGGSLGNSLGGLFGAGMGIASNNQQSNLQQNAYTTAGNAANYNPFNFSGLGGMGASFQNGTGTLSAGGFNPQGFQGLTNTANNSAAQYAGGGLPQGVSQAGNNYMSALGGAQGNAQAGMGGGLGMFNQGSNLVNGANGTYNSAYNTSLNAAQQALQQPLQQQYNALRNQQFETGQTGTSGGALQTQAFATGMGQAELQAQQNAVSQANTAQGNALGYGTNLMNSGLNNFGQFNTQGAGFAGQGLNTQMGLGTYSPQLSSMYSNLANTGVSGFSGVNSMSQGLAQLGLQGMQIGGNNMNNAARTQGGIAQNNNYTNQNAGYSTALNSLFGNGAGSGGGGILGSLFGKGGGGAGGGILGGLSSLFGGGSNNPSAFGMDQTNQLSNNFAANMPNGLPDFSLPGFDGSDFNNLNIPAMSNDMYGGMTMDNMGDYGF